jgi:capsular polysaccharide biosynthesis protein
VRVESLYVVPWASTVSNHAVSTGVLDNIVTDWAVESIDWLRDLLRREFVSAEAYKNFRKIFLSNSSSVRTAINRDDVEKEFERRGYTIIEDARLLKGSPMHLSDKMQTFSGLGHLSGFSGSSYFNLLFTSPCVRGVMLGPSLRAAEFLTASGIFRNVEIEFFPCAELRSDPHSEFYVPMRRLIRYLDGIT